MPKDLEMFEKESVITDLFDHKRELEAYGFDLLNMKPSRIEVSYKQYINAIQISYKNTTTNECKNTEQIGKAVEDEEFQDIVFASDEFITEVICGYNEK